MDGNIIEKLVESVTKPWTKQRKREEREANARARRRDAMTRSDRYSIKDAAWDVMEKAYMKASADGALPAHARQVMYAARPEVQEATGQTMNDQYFIQTLLPDYMNENKETTAGWNVVFDARGHLCEPHTDYEVPLGTIDVREYLSDIHAGDKKSADSDEQLDRHSFPTRGPAHRYGAILFIEKEGFLPLLREVQLAERFDVAIMSTKGMSVTASRTLVDSLCGPDHDVPLYVLHDFDKSGFSILGTLQRDTRRYEFQNKVKVIDLGLRLEDVKKHGLQSEDVHYGRSDPTDNLADNDATRDEIAFLCAGGDPYHGYRGKRVELNAFTSQDFVAWIEGKLKKHGVKKIVPADDVLDGAYKRVLSLKLLDREMEPARKRIEEKVACLKLPRGLRKRLIERLKRDPAVPWDRALVDEIKVSDERGKV